MLLLVAVAADAVQLREQLAFELASGRTLTAELRRPRQSAGQPLPAVMLFGGFRGAATVLDAVPPELPLVAVSFDYPFDPPRRFRFPQSLADVPALGRGIDETFEGIRWLTAALRARPDIDAQRLSIVGASLGAPFATVSAAELELPGLVIVHGFGEVRQVIAHQFVRAFEPRWGGWVRWPAQGLATLLTWGYRLPAPERYARRLGTDQRALMLVAGDDELIPAVATESLWRALRSSAAHVERIDESGGHLRGGDDPRIASLVPIVLDWLRGAGLL